MLKITSSIGIRIIFSLLVILMISTSANTQAQIFGDLEKGDEFNFVMDTYINSREIFDTRDGSNFTTEDNEEFYLGFSFEESDKLDVKILDNVQLGDDYTYYETEYTFQGETYDRDWFPEDFPSSESLVFQTNFDEQLIELEASQDSFYQGYENSQDDLESTRWGDFFIINSREEFGYKIVQVQEINVENPDNSTSQISSFEMEEVRIQKSNGVLYVDRYETRRETKTTYADGISYDLDLEELVFKRDGYTDNFFFHYIGIGTIFGVIIVVLGIEVVKRTILKDPDT